MNRTLVFLRIARRELEDAIAWYDREQPGLGYRFGLAVDEVLDAIVRKPNRYPIIEPDIREGYVIDFPYAVLYAVRRRTILIVAVYHTHRDPDGWKNRL